MELNRYQLDLYTAPYWSGNTVFHEPLLLLEDPDGSVPELPLLYPAKQILSVRSSDLQTQYREGVDYVLRNGKLQIPEGSSLPRMSYSTYYPDQPTDTCKVRNERFGDGYIFFSEGALMHSLQIAVTYTHCGSFTGPVPECKMHLLPRTAAKLTGELKLCIYGDSICVGGNASGFVEAPPFAPTWWQMLTEKLEQHGCNVQVDNPSVGGKTSQWGAEEAAERVGYGPELCIIGFGMNDGTKRIPPEDYGRNIITIMEAARKGNSNCEFVLIAPTVPNAQVSHFMGLQEQYLPVLRAMEGPGVAVADMTGFHQFLLTKKRFFDMSGNNVNHPNDFLSRAYAQVLWQTIVGYDK